MLTSQQLTDLRPYGFDLRLPLVVGDEDVVPAWTTVVPVYEDGRLHWPCFSATVMVGILSGPRRGEILLCNSAELAHALGHV